MAFLYLRSLTKMSCPVKNFPSFYGIWDTTDVICFLFSLEYVFLVFCVWSIAKVCWFSKKVPSLVMYDWCIRLLSVRVGVIVISVSFIAITSVGIHVSEEVGAIMVVLLSSTLMACLAQGSSAWEHIVMSFTKWNLQNEFF